MSTIVAELKADQISRNEMNQFTTYVTLAIVANLVVAGWGQRQSSGGSSSCLNQLTPCLDYLNRNNGDVPDSCCDPLESLIKSRPECLCSMISIKGSRQAEKAGINVTLAQQLPGRCGQHVNPLGCLSGSRGSETSAQDSAFVFPSYSTAIAVTICMAVQILLFMMI